MRVFLTTAIAVLVFVVLGFAPVKSNRVRNRPNQAVDWIAGWLSLAAAGRRELRQKMEFR